MKDAHTTYHSEIAQVRIIEGQNNFPICWLNTQGYCEYCIYLENVKGISAAPTMAMKRGSKVHRSLEDEFKKDAVPTTMEEMMETEDLAILVDLSLHEMADHRFGGDYDAGPRRGAVALERRIPTIIVPGNIDFLVTGPLENALRQFPDRPYHVHNAAITVVRTDQQEIKILAQTIANLCNKAKGPL